MKTFKQVREDAAKHAQHAKDHYYGAHLMKKYGEEIGCAIVLKETMTISEKELIEYASQNLAKFKIPDKFIFCNEIPKGPTGKLQRIGLSKTLGLDDEQL